MASYTQENDIVGGGLGFGGGGIAMILVVLVVLWTLFRDGGHKDGYDHGPHGYGYGDGCGPCVQPTYKDESNWEQDFHICKELGVVDKDVIEQGCKNREAIYCDGNKTREYIAHLQERADDKAYNALAMSNMQKDNYIQTLQLMGGYNEKIGQLFGVMEKGFCKTDNKIDKLDCECLKRPPVWGEGITPNTHHTDCDDRRGFRDNRRGRCNDWDDGCCA